MPRLRIEARAEWRSQSKESKNENTLISAVNAGDSIMDWQSEKIRAVSDLKALFQAVNSKKKITFLMEPHYALRIFPKGRDIDFLSIEFREWEAKTASLTPTCKDLKVVKTAATNGNQSAITLQLSNSGFSS